MVRLSFLSRTLLTCNEFPPAFPRLCLGWEGGHMSTAAVASPSAGTAPSHTLSRGAGAQSGKAFAGRSKWARGRPTRRAGRASVSAWRAACGWCRRSAAGDGRMRRWRRMAFPAMCRRRGKARWFRRWQKVTLGEGSGLGTGVR